MAFETDRDDDDADALVKQLGGGGTNVPNDRVTTMPVSSPAPFAATPPPATAPPPAAPPRTPTQASVFQGFTPKHAMEGFAFDREQNTGKSAKDAFAALSNQAPPPPIHDKSALANWFNEYIRPGMTDLGHNVTVAAGDKFHLNNWQGDFDVDFGRGAGAEGGALAWQVDDDTARMPATANYKPMMQPAAVAPTDTDASAQDQLQKEIDAIINGRGSPIDQQALLEQLQV